MSDLATPITPSARNSGVAVLTAGKDRPYALGLAATLISLKIPFDFIASDFLESPELHQNPLVRFLNLRGDQTENAPFATRLRRITKYYLRLMAYAATSQHQVFHILWNNSFDTFDRTLLLLYYKLLGKRLVFTAHNVNINKRDKNDTWWNRFTLGIQYRLLDHIFVHTEQMRRELLTDFQVPEKKITVIAFPINNSVPDTALTSAEARAKLGLVKEDKTMLFFGKIAAYKGLEYLIEALQILTKNGEEYRVIVAGQPKGSEAYWESVRQQINAAGLGEYVIQRIEYVPDEDTEIYFKAADVFVLPYTHIFQSGVLFLGYNFGLPVIATDVGSFRDDIIEGETGYVCKPKDAVELAKCIQCHFRSPLYLDLETQRKKIRHHAHERYSWGKVGAITSAVYRSLSPGSI